MSTEQGGGFLGALTDAARVVLGTLARSRPPAPVVIATPPLSSPDTPRPEDTSTQVRLRHLFRHHDSSNGARHPLLHEAIRTHRAQPPDNAGMAA